MIFWAGSWAVSLFTNSPLTVEEVTKLAAHAAEVQEFVLYWPEVFTRDRQIALEEDYYKTVPTYCLDRIGFQPADPYICGRQGRGVFTELSVQRCADHG